MLMTGMVASAQSVIVEDVTVKTNETASVNIVLRGATAYTAIGFSLELPEDFMVATEMDNGVMNYMIDVNSDFIDDHMVVSKMKSTNNVMRVVVFSEKNKPFKSNDGTILTLIVKTTGKKGTYHAKLKSLELANSSNNVVTLSDVSFNIKVESIGVIGDVNNDGSITVADVMGQVSIIMGKDNETTPKFNHETADINSDNAVTVADVMALVKIILNGGSAVSPTLGLSLSESMLNMEIGQRELVVPFNGSGIYAVMSSNEQVAKVVVKQESLLAEDDEYMLVWVTAVGLGSTTITVTDTQTGETATIDVSVTGGGLCPDDHHPHMIDLGLPSGTKWACCNVGATTPEGYGDYFAWGETEVKDGYSFSNYIHCDGSSTTCHDLGESIAGTEYDVAHVKWGGGWMMPSYDQQTELRENCSSELTTVNGINGRIFTGPNGSSIFMPAAGYWEDDELRLVSKNGSYWSSTQHPSYLYYAYSLRFSSGIDWYKSYRNYGFSVRPVFTPLQLSVDTVEIEMFHTYNVQITSGNGSYAVSSSDENVATTAIDGSTVKITAIGTGTATITVTDTQTGETATIYVSVTEGGGLCPDDHHPHMIDLGLPSGSKWACCNVGATTPEGYGDYFAWGETEVKDEYTLGNYIHCDGSSTTCHDLGESIAGTEYDVAHVKWGGGWMMPSYDQQTELRENCSSEWTTVNGINGRIFTGSNGNSIFLPLAGVFWDDELRIVGKNGSYWSSTQYPKYLYYAYDLYFGSEVDWYYHYRHYGQSVRPVAVNTYLPLKLSASSLSLSIGEESTVSIISGNGNFTVRSSDTRVVTASLAGSSVKVTAVGAGTAAITVTDSQSGATASIEVTVSISLESLCPDDNHPHMIDLGLPSGTKWACCNVGATTPVGYGDHYAWGETEVKDEYSFSNYIHCDGSSTTCHDLGESIAGTEYDVAHVKWGGGWMMPSYDQQTELRENCSSGWTTVNGINGRIFTGSNGSSIFLPGAGYRWNVALNSAGSDGTYWSSTQYPSNTYDAYFLFFSSNGIDLSHYRYRSYGRSVRPVAR